ncbi:MAG: NAD(P)H-dependent oxidoreductase subunit E [Prolixibacteraceae bacterium]|nr:NAD(P)H-dependent oxidoreductase subunit E [Prolixibacteraceae bacterium]
MMGATVDTILSKYRHDSTRLMDILIDVQDEKSCISDDTVKEIAKGLKISMADVEQTLSFYHFFSKTPTGKYTVYLNDSVVAFMMGREKIAKAFEEAVGCKFGEVTADGLIGLFNTSCIGMNDQEPAAIINNRVFTRLTPFRVKELVKDMKAGKDIDEMYSAKTGDGNNSHELVHSVVNNHIRKEGPILKTDVRQGEIIEKITKMTPEEVIKEIKDSNIRGRGGAGFPTGLKWEFCRRAPGKQKYIFCNADEGEPGTFKDRVILTEKAKLLFEGMTMAGYAVGATQGILYLRYEYKYLQKYLEDVIEKAEKAGWLGKNIGGRKNFEFYIRIQFGAGAYVCGEESALIESAEGKRGEPRDRPPFPVEKGYLECPTVVNNVETLCAAVKIMKYGSEWYKSLGTAESTGTKVLSISGDCFHPGVYEIEWGFTINNILDMVAGFNVQAVQVGGPSGALIAPNEFDRILGYEDLATGGSLIIFNESRNILKDVVLNFTEFFIEESCGSCSTCRILPVVMKDKLVKILNGLGVTRDIDDLLEWGKILKASRCGLGQTAANPITSSINNFRHLYTSLLKTKKDYETGFDLNLAVQEACEATNRIANV